MNTLTKLPSIEEMYDALLKRDSQYEGIFFVGVRTTGIFCRPTCPARKPKLENVEFYATSKDALAAGFRPCKRCRPLDVFGEAPMWIRELLDEVENDLSRRWTDQQLRDRGIQPEKLRRWFNKHHGMTFQAYMRSRRLSQAMGQIQVGESVTNAAIDNGYQSLSAFREAFRNWCGHVPKVTDHQSPMIVNRITSPLGPLVAAVAEDKLWLLEFSDRRMLETQFRRVLHIARRPLVTDNHPLIDRTANQLEEYFSGDRKQFELPLYYPGTSFQTQVWKQLLKIPYSKTMSYDQMARKIGHAGAQRAVGRANGDNRLAIIVPCHRVIRSDGTLSGYGGGLWRKKWLLDLEREQV